MLEIVQTVVILAIGILVLIKELPQMKVGRSKERIALLDSCALIDGRIVELARLGFMPFDLAVPEFVIAELQFLADGTDAHKRERARFGLEVVQQLQQEPSVNVKIERTKVQAKNTDDKLVRLAKKIEADLYTTDFNLNQVASIEGVRVLNVNELSHALRPIALPGETFEVKILQAGSNRDQGVGYLEDGTMIVIDNARRDMGKKVRVRVTRTHQTVAGKMLFAQKVSEVTTPDHRTGDAQPDRDSRIRSVERQPRRDLRQTRDQRITK
ncbi:MAG TPA: TRAM domain-containing protein [Patescibacteria group bacterium]|nr:TRAM domain-containing protein [Patescibacteria group bacterium]